MPSAMPFLLFDVAIVMILAFFMWRGIHRGLIISLFGLVSILVALVGANFLANTLAPKVSAALEPRFSAVIEDTLGNSFPSAGGSAADYPLQDVLNALKGFGLYEELIDSVDKAVQNGMSQVAASAAASVASVLAQSVAYMLIFGVAFLLILLVWNLLARVLDLVARLPVLHLFNKTGGALIGLAKACILLFVGAWLLRISGKLIPEEAVAQTVLLKFFMTTNPISLITGI